MPQLLPRITFRRLLVIGGCLAWGSALHGDDQITQASSGDRVVPIKSGNGTAYIKVQDSDNPYKNVQDSGPEKSPEHFSFNTTSSFANKSYATASANVEGGDSYQKNVERTFITKSYFTNKPGDTDNTTPGLHTPFTVKSYDGYNRAAGYDKSYLTADADTGANKKAEFADAPSDYQDRTAEVGGHPVKTFSNPLGTKTFLGPEADKVRHDINQVNDGLTGLKELPNRPLTIDEVRALINHGIKPDVDEKPAAPSKALNDPDYMPDPAPPPLRPSDPGHLHDLNDGVPDPGTMTPLHGAPPENSEPLPQ